MREITAPLLGKLRGPQVGKPACVVSPIADPKNYGAKSSRSAGGRFRDVIGYVWELGAGMFYMSSIV